MFKNKVDKKCELGHTLYKISLDNSCYKCINCNIMFLKNHNNDDYKELEVKNNK